MNVFLLSILIDRKYRQFLLLRINLFFVEDLELLFPNHLGVIHAIIISNHKLNKL